MSYNFNFTRVWQAMPDLIHGLGLGLGLAALSAAIAMLLGMLVAFATISSQAWVRRLAGTYITIFRNIPLLLIIYFAFFALPQLGITLDKYTAFAGSLTLYGAAYMAEIFRGGLKAIPRGSFDAGRAIGLTPLQLQVSILMPLLIIKTRPALGNAYISFFKDTSLAAAIGVPELTYYARKLNTETFRILEVWLVTSALYVLAAFLIANALRYLDRKALVRFGMTR